MVLHRRVFPHHNHIELLIVKFARFALELSAYRFHVLDLSAFIELIYHALTDVYTHKVLAEWSELFRDQSYRQEYIELSLRSPSINERTCTTSIFHDSCCFLIEGAYIPNCFSGSASHSLVKIIKNPRRYKPFPALLGETNAIEFVRDGIVVSLVGCRVIVNVSHISCCSLCFEVKLLFAYFLL